MLAHMRAQVTNRSRTRINELTETMVGLRTSLDTLSSPRRKLPPMWRNQVRGAAAMGHVGDGRGGRQDALR